MPLQDLLDQIPTGSNAGIDFDERLQLIEQILTSNELVILPPGTQGQIIYHNGTTWVPLEPGVAGQDLNTGGAGADPYWA